MRAVFSILGLLAVLLMVSMLVKKQLSASVPATPSLQRPAPVNPALTPAAAPPGTSPQMQSQQLQQQVRQSLECALQQARPVPDDQ